MPNLKPTSVATTDCPACSFGRGVYYPTDGAASDGQLDASSAECRQCVWEKRLKPGLFDQGVKTFWLDDDEQDRFHTAFACGPSEYCGASFALGSASFLLLWRQKRSSLFFLPFSYPSAPPPCTRHMHSRVTPSCSTDAFMFGRRHVSASDVSGMPSYHPRQPTLMTLMSWNLTAFFGRKITNLY